MRKNRENVLESEIAKLFSNDKQQEVAAWFAGQTHNVTKVRAKKQPSDIFGAIELDDCPQRHFSQSRVSELVYPAPYGRRYGDQLHDGALQVFVEPREEQDSILRLIWTAAGCVTEKRTNKHELVPTMPAADSTASFHTAASAAAPSPSIDHRIASFGTIDPKQPPMLGPTSLAVGSMLHHSHEFVTVNAIKMRLEEFGDNIANHLFELSRETTSVTRMELFFKVKRLITSPQTDVTRPHPPPDPIRRLIRKTEFGSSSVTLFSSTALRFPSPPPPPSPLPPLRRARGLPWL